MRVLHKPSGKYGEIPDDKFDPTIFERIDQPQQSSVQSPVQTSQPQQGGITSKVGQFLIDTLFGSTKKAIQNAPQRAVESQGFMGGLQEAGANAIGPIGQLLFGTERQKEAARGGAELASFAVPFGKGAGLLKRAVLPGAFAGGLSSASKENATAASILGGATLGGGLAGGSELVASGIKGLLGGVGKVTNKASDTLATKSLRLAPKQVKSLEKVMGKDVPTFLRERGLEGKGADDIADYIQPLQESFDSIARDPNLKVKANNLYSAFKTTIKDLRSSSLPEQKAKASYIQQVLKNLKKTYKGSAQGADVISGLKTEVGKLVKDFAIDPTNKGKLQVLSDVYRKVVQDSAEAAGRSVDGQSVKEMGIELQKLYKLHEIAEKQSGLGKGSLPLGITTLLGGLMGSSAGPAGMVAGLAASKVANNPNVIGGATRALSSAGSALESAGSSKGLDFLLGGGAQMRGQSAAQMPRILDGLIPKPSNEENGYNNNQNINQDSPIIPQEQNTSEQPILSKGGQWRWDATANDWVPNEQSQNKRPSKEEFQMLLVQDLQNNSGKNISKIKSVYDVLYPEGEKEKGVPNAVKVRQDLSKAGLRAQKDVVDMFNNDPSIVIKGVVTGGLLSRKYDSAISRAVEGLLRARSGAAVPDSEVRKYVRDYGPRVGDTKKTALYKLEQLRLDLQDALDNENVVPDSVIQQ